MFKKFKLVYRKLHSFFFGDEIEHIHTREEMKKYYGRINTEPKAEAKIIHQYPKKGKFRFPIGLDKDAVTAPKKELPTSEKGKPRNFVTPKKQAQPSFQRLEKQVPLTPIQKKETKVQQLSGINKEQKKANVPLPIEKKQQEKKKFQGVNFKAREIPSPIYAFEKRPNKMNEKDIQQEQLLEERVSVEQLDNAIKKEPIEAPLLVTPLEITEIELREYVAKEIIINEEIAATEIFNEEVESICHLEQIEMREEQEIPLNEVVENEDVQREYEENDRIDTNQEEGEDEDEDVLLDAPKEQTVLKSNVSPPRTLIPFNVLMFQKDKIALQKKQPNSTQPYQFPTLQLLNIPPRKSDNSELWLEEKQQILEVTLNNFNVQAKVVGVTKGPSVTRFEIQPEAGVKVSKITSLTDDIKLSLAAKDIRMEAPIPGRNAIGIEVPNEVSEPVLIREILRSGEFQQNPSPLTVAMGLDITGKPIVTDIQKMPHGLIAGSTGSGKSVCINSILISIMFKATPDEVKLMLIDPKMVELAPYNDIPHLVTPVITDAKQATIALKWAVEEMERRYELFVQNGVRDIKRFNEVMGKKEDSKQHLPYIVIIIDELADLMMVSPGDVEEAICRIAQKARACGIHLLVATQRPSVDVITGLIKANIPTRIAFSVSSQADSRTIIDASGAERLLGKGDMLLFENGASKPLRVQGNFVSDEEIDRVIDLVKQQRKPNYLFDKESLVKSYEIVDQEDELFEEACYFILEQGVASSSSLQRRFRIGFNRAARLIDMMEGRGIISEAMGSKPRNVLITEDELLERL